MPPVAVASCFAGSLYMKRVFLCEQVFFAFAVVRIVNTAVDRANRSALRLIVKANAFGAFVGNDIVNVQCDRILWRLCIGRKAALSCKFSPQRGAIRESPFRTAFIDGVVRAFRLAGPAVDTFFGDFDRHNK